MSNDEKKLLWMLWNQIVYRVFMVVRKKVLGGPKIIEFEERWSDQFKCRYSVTVNSYFWPIRINRAIWTSPGDEFIVPCTTMSASAMAPLIYGAIPVFADIDTNNFCIDLDSVKELINEKTKEF